MQCEFFLIRYVPDAVKGEFANIGVVLREAGRDEPRGGALYARLEPGALHGCGRGYRAAGGAGGRDCGSGCGWARAMLKPVMAVLEDTLSNSVQMTRGAGMPGGERAGGAGAADAACMWSR